MRIKLLMMPLVAALMPFTFATANASDDDGLDCGHRGRGRYGYGVGYGSGYGSGCGGGSGGYYRGSNNYGGCYSYNRDGISCAQVGYGESQVGVPWGFGGVFKCQDGCLLWIGPSE